MPRPCSLSARLLRFAFFLLLGLLSFRSRAQQANIEQVGAAGQANLNALANGSPAPLYLGRTDGVEGNPYAERRWLPARLVTTTKLPLVPVPLKYDVLNHRLLMRPYSPAPDSLLLDERAVVGFVLLEPTTAGQPARERVFRRFTEAATPAQRGHYVEVLYQGRYTLLKHYVKVLHKAPASTGYGIDTPTASLEDKTEYFLLGPDAKLHPVKLTLKSLQSAAPTLSLPAAPARTEADWVATLQQADPSH